MLATVRPHIPRMQDYHKLRVWKKAHALAINVRRATRDFPRGYGDLARQLIRAAESISINIVEGCGADSPKEFARFLDISIKSSNETEYELKLAHDNGALTTRPWAALTAEVVEIRKMLCGLRAKVLASDPSRSAGNQTTDKPKTANGPRGSSPPDLVA